MKFGLSSKLILGFLVVGLITVGVGFTGWYGIHSAVTQIDDLGNETVPTVSNMDNVELDLMQIKTSLRTIASAYLADEEFRNQLSLIATETAAYKKTLETYKAIISTTEERRLFDLFVVDLTEYGKEIDSFVDQVKTLRSDGTKSDVATGQLTRMATTGNLEKKSKVMNDSLDRLQVYIQETFATKQVKEAMDQAAFLNVLVLSVAALGVFLALLLGIVLARSVSKPIVKITSELHNASKSLESASLQVSSSSQELSSGASELASSIEEMTSSLEELQSIIESNTKNVNQSELLMQETSVETKKVTDRMNDLKSALSEISSNSKKIFKIIKVIDDIAFQTNILALNAAVEAARAGDAGKGFAVVADQVKALAQKSAEAAKETSELIEQAIDSVGKGETLGQVALEAQLSAVDKATKVSVLLDEVNRASKEQLKGANQINQAVGQINAVVQATSASSEENAAAGEELLGQAESLGTNVGQLNRIITGRAEAESRTTVIDAKTPHRALPSVHPALPHNETHGEVRAETAPKPEEVIPLKDFKDF